MHTRTRSFCEFCTPRATIPGVRVQHFLYPPGTSVTSVRPCHNARNFCDFNTRNRNFSKFCKTPIPLTGIHKPLQNITLEVSVEAFSMQASVEAASVDSPGTWKVPWILPARGRCRGQASVEAFGTSKLPWNLLPWTSTKASVKASVDAFDTSREARDN